MRKLWAYAYRVVPVPPPIALGALRQALDAENAAAFEQSRSWAAQLIVEPHSTRILVVSDTPAQHGAVNRRLETTLRHLGGMCRVSSPTPPVLLGGAGARTN